MNIRRCFEILEIELGASLEEVKKAHRDMVFIWHPDRISSNKHRLKQKAGEKMKAINAAYEYIISFLCENGNLWQVATRESDDDKAEKPASYQPYPGDYSEAANYFRLGIAYGEAEKHRQAVKCFSHVIRLNPEDANAYYNRGIAYNKSGSYKRAIKDFTQTIRLDPNYAIAYINRGYIYAELDDFDQACSDFQKAYELGNSVGTEWARKRGLCL
ncbi:tetratricopeptide repeat protein [Desulfococcaceae bacterium HSG8]|nr:tetratricopeptide repeat protein [Desulfococcaceae bacterium HSG8]